MLVGGVPIRADGWPLALMPNQGCTLAWLPPALTTVTAGRPGFAVLDARDAGGNPLAPVSAAPP